jgi:hypothetical protein
MRDLNTEELKQVFGGCYCECPPEETQKGNNGWGNGGDDPAPGNSTQNDNSQTQSKIDDEER